MTGAVPRSVASLGRSSAAFISGFPSSATSSALTGRFPLGATTGGPAQRTSTPSERAHASGRRSAAVGQVAAALTTWAAFSRRTVTETAFASAGELPIAATPPSLEGATAPGSACGAGLALVASGRTSASGLGLVAAIERAKSAMPGAPGQVRPVASKAVVTAHRPCVGAAALTAPAAVATPTLGLEDRRAAGPETGPDKASETSGS